MRRKNKSALTLIEMLLVISLLAIAFGVISVPISKALKKEKFERGVDQLLVKLALAQELMLDFQTNVSLTLALDQEHEKVTCRLETERRLPDHLETSINRYGKVAGIQEMQFDDSVRNTLVLYFDASFGTTSKGVLTLISGMNKAQINLKGYPARIKRGDDEENECQVPYPEEILSAL
jgi:prepilin-type N-terminal cleavage/methylation domain-containing protein